MHWLKKYTEGIANITASGDATEFSYRTYIDNMLQSAVEEFGIAVDILQEPSRDKKSGAPDFRISDNGGGIIGYVECKTPGANLQKITTTAQLEKYRELSGNILLTDSWRWLLLRDGKKINDVTLPEKPSKKIKTEFTNILRIFIESEAEKIGDAKRLAVALARRCALLRAGFGMHSSGSPKTSQIHGLLTAFRTALDTNFTFAQFADAFAQTLVYSLLLAKLKAPAGTKINLYTINQHIPTNFAVIREITTFLQNLDDSKYKNIAWVVDDILATINAMDAAAVTESMSYRNGGKGFDDSDDPYLYFYENFLAAYDSKMRESRGVYYTPPPVVKFIVRAVDDLLRSDFGFPNGLAETNKITALDFAAGTGTFMLEMMRTVLDGKSKSSRDILTHGHLLKNFYGFELLVAPYAIAHLKLSQFLADNDVPLKQDERINIFLTNTLEQLKGQVELPFMPELAEEANRAQAIKDAPVLVICGNPPYSGISQNKGEWISNLIETYKYVDGQHFGERKHWLNDDYVKFIRFAQWKMENVKHGIVAIITNHGFLDNPTFRGMRQSLMNTFDTLYFLDLHGNTNRQESAPDGGRDENVFDIQQGVAISILVKNSQMKKKKIFHASLWGLREEKYKACETNDIGSIDWRTLTPDSSPYLFVPRSNMPEKYNASFSMTDIFLASVSGIVTARDHFAIDFDEEVLLQRMRKFIDTSKDDSEVAAELNLKNTRGWEISAARESMEKIEKLEGLDDIVKKVLHRPFDTRWIFYDSSAVDWGRQDFMRHMLVGDNYGLLTSRITKDAFSCFCTDLIATHKSAVRYDITYLFPMYRHDVEMGETIRRENIEPKFRRWIDDHYGIAHSPEDILGYIYAILYSPDYRKHYADFLRSDFPRIPFPNDNNEFKRLATIGTELINAHLLRENCTGNLGQLEGTGTSHKVEKIKYDEKTERLYFNQNEYFAPIPPEVFNFQIGGYQPLDKYLKSRKNRTLTLPETETIQKVTNAIAFTIGKMQEIDQ